MHTARIFLRPSFRALMRYGAMAAWLSAACPPAALAAATAQPGKDMNIAAEVGGDAISSYDVANRIKFIVATAHLSDSPDVIEKIRPQVLRSLVDEKLELQEAAKNDIKVSDQDVEQAVQAIEDQRNMPHGTIYSLMDRANIPHETFTSQIRAQIAWSKLLSKKVRPLVKVSDQEITLASQRYTPPVKKKVSMADQFRIAVITLPVDKKSHEGEVHRLGDKLAKETRGGASFEEVARQFSSNNASSGGKVETFWVRINQLERSVAQALAGATAGTITDPIRTPEGYTIIKVYDTRGGNQKEDEPEEKPKDTEVTLKEILLKLKPDAGSKEAEMMLQIGEDVAKHPGTCDEKGIASLGNNLDDFDIEVNFQTQMLSELPPAIKIIAENLKVGDISTPFASYEGIRLYMLCGKRQADAKPVDRTEVSHMLMQQKMELEAQKYLRNLRREVFVDIR